MNKLTQSPYSMNEGFCFLALIIHFWIRAISNSIYFRIYRIYIKSLWNWETSTISF